REVCSSRVHRLTPPCLLVIVATHYRTVCIGHDTDTCVPHSNSHGVFYLRSYVVWGQDDKFPTAVNPWNYNILLILTSSVRLNFKRLDSLRLGVPLGIGE